MTPSASGGGKKLSLRDLANGEEGQITALPSSDGCAERLEALGLRAGKIVKKVSGMPFHGPVTLLLEGRQIAIGWRLSSGILVNPMKGHLLPHGRGGE